MKAVWWLVAGMLIANVAVAETKIGYIDLQRALNESDSGKKAKEDFKVQVDRLQDKLKKQKDEIDNLKDRLEKKSLVMKDEERNNLEEEYRKKMRDFERNYKDTQADLQKKDNEMTGAIVRELQEIIREYGEREGYTVILETSSNAVVYGAKSADVTDEIIQRYNTAHPAKKK
ncbi:MAG: putative OmpH-like outer membrane protein [Deltaproteobacteria bacterium]|jgi:outer membrane protein|nr:putative OmpH-like outer membrane protein [Deltaproteobacteria bacterium]